MDQAPFALLEHLQRSWSLSVPASVICKGDGEGESTLEGYASVEGDDHGGEEVLQEGLDWSYFLQDGFFKWRHETANRIAGPDDFVAISKSVELVDLNGVKASKVTGVFRDTPTAKSVIKLADDLQKAGRQLGLSIEGGTSARSDEHGHVAYLCSDRKWRDDKGAVVENPGKKIVKGIVIDVAIDPHPMHPKGRMSVSQQLAKSLMGALEAGSPEPAPPADRRSGSELLPQSIEGRVNSRKKRASRALANGDAEVERIAKSATAERYDTFKPERTPISDELLHEIKRWHIGDFMGFKVWEVDGDVIEAEVDDDWTVGGNPARYGYVPLDEIWIQSCMTEVSKAATLIHEYVETIAMRDEGKDYEHAHDLANVPEQLFRWTCRHGVLIVRDFIVAAYGWLFNESEMEEALSPRNRLVAAVLRRYRWFDVCDAEALVDALNSELAAATSAA